jgi:glycosyltransferase involved in cell wall biosynthesis
MIDDLLALAHQLGIGDRVHFQPAVPQHELLDWTSSADIGVIPYPAVDLNHQFCSPNKLFEFIQAGLPIVANDLPFLRDVVVGEAIGAVAPIEQADRFAAAIDSIAQLDVIGREALLERLRAAAPRFSWASQEPVLRGLYAGLGPLR